MIPFRCGCTGRPDAPLFSRMMQHLGPRPVIAGVSCFDLEPSQDADGETGAFEFGDNVPFPCRRVFTIRAGAAGFDRGGHANSCDEFIVAITGAVRVQVDNGRERSEVWLKSSRVAVWIKAGVLIDLCDFAPHTILLVCASMSYAETRHFDAPQPGLLTS